MKKKNKKKKIIIKIAIVIMIIGITIFAICKFRNRVGVISPNSRIKENQKIGILKCESNMVNVVINNTDKDKEKNQNYILIEIQNNGEDDKYDLGINIDFYNKEGTPIYRTATIVPTFYSKNIELVKAKITPEIAKAIDDDIIDHIAISRSN